MKLLALLCLLALAACGAKGPLKWPDGEPPPAPIGAKDPLTSEKMIVPPPEAAPDRVDDPVRRSEERGEDEFDLPPPGG